MAHSFRVIEASTETDSKGEPRYFAVCTEGNSRDGCCYVSSTHPTPSLAFLFGLFHQKKERGMLTYR